MEAKIILYPMLAMVLLVFIVAITMLKRRIAGMKAGRISPQKVALSRQIADLLPDTRASDNFKNLFEVPVLFYAALITIYALKLGTLAYLVLAWVYVLCRYAHSFIQCTFNRVRYRFYAFFLSCVAIATIWTLIAYDLIIAGRG